MSSSRPAIDPSLALDRLQFEDVLHAPSAEAAADSATPAANTSASPSGDPLQALREGWTSAMRMTQPLPGPRGSATSSTSPRVSV